MSEPPLDGGPEQPAQGPPADSGTSGPASPDYASPDYASPDYNGAPDDADESPRRSGAHRASGRPTPPPPPPAGAPYWPQPDYQPDEQLKRPLADTLPLTLLKAGGALIGVIALILILVALFNRNKTTDKDALLGGPPKTTAGATKSPLATTSTSATSKATTSAAGATKTAKPTKTSKPAKTTAPGKTTAPTKTTAPAKTTAPPKTAKPTSKPTAKPTVKPTTVAPPPVSVKAPLLVLNNSRIHGLAQTGRTTFENGGWTVTGTGNYSGRLAQTTVFYSPGLKAAADTLARQFPTVTLVEPRPANVPGSSLTVVLTRYFKP